MDARDFRRVNELARSDLEWDPSIAARFSGPFRWAGQDSNLRPTDYESAALTS
jgi:hypothetical protein